MAKNVWILHHYGTPPSLTGLTRPYHFAKYLIAAGYNSKVFAASYQHYAGYDLMEDGRRYMESGGEGVPFVYVKTPGYEGSGLARIKNMTAFYFGVKRCARELAKRDGKPDVIIASTPHPLTCLAGLSLAKRFGCKCILEVRDLWPLSFVAYGIVGKNNPLLKLLYAGEKWLYKKADKLIFTMEGGKDYIIDKGWDTAHGGPIDLNKVYHINNGVDIEAFDYNREHYTLEDEDLINKDSFKVVYAGSIRRVNKIKLLVEAAEKLREYKDIVFLIYGDGTERQELEQYCIEKGLKNVKFKGRVEKKYVPYVLSHSDINLSGGADSSLLTKYGWSLNKMFDYLASGKPMLTAFEMKYSLFDKFKCGRAANITSAEQYAEEILYFKNMDASERQRMCEEARRGALAYDFKELTNKLIGVLEG